jgi:peptidyl-prolyl cis-trans isomerase C
LRSKAIVYVLAAGIAVSACKKGPAQQAAGSPQASGTAATPGGSGAPPVPAKPVPAQLPDVVARVNGEAVKKDDFERMLKTIERQAGGPIPPDRRDEIVRNALDQLIVYTLLTQESKTRGVKVEDSEIEQKMGQLKQQFPNQEAFEKALQERGMTLDRLRQDARNDLTVNKLMETEVSTLPGPSDAEAKEFYTKNPDKFQESETVRASHVLVRVDEKADAAAKKKARAEIDAVLKQAKAGADFGKLAQQHSQDGSASQGGDLGYFPKGQMVPAFDKVAFELKPGQISDVVTTQFGYHVIKVIDHKAGRVVPFEEAQARIKDFLGREKKQAHADKFIAELKKKSKIEVLI